MSSTSSGEPLDSCYLAVADVTADRPNVMYELGMAHAAGKPVIMLRRAKDSGRLTKLPFDIQSESVISYTDDLTALRRQIGAAIAVLLGKAGSALPQLRN